MFQYFGRISFFPDRRVPNKAVIYRGETLTSTTHLTVEFFIEAATDRQAAEKLLSQINEVTDGDSRQVIGLESIDSLKVKEEEMEEIRKLVEERKVDQTLKSVVDLSRGGGL